MNAWKNEGGGSNILYCCSSIIITFIINIIGIIEEQSESEDC